MYTHNQPFMHAYTHTNQHNSQKAFNHFSQKHHKLFHGHGTQNNQGFASIVETMVGEVKQYPNQFVI